MEKVDSTSYLTEYHVGLATQWDDLTGWKDRLKAEGTFLLDFLNNRDEIVRVFDAATGTGFHAIMLSQAGFEVTAIDGAAEMVRVARQNFEKRGGNNITCTVGDWLHMETMPQGPFDAVICLGNSLAHLFSVEDLDLALTNFSQLLRPGGVIVVDQRNYDGIIAGKVSGKSQNYCCTGLKGTVEVAVINPETVEITYTTVGNSPNKIRTHAWRVSDIQAALQRTGFFPIGVSGEGGQPFDVDRSEFAIHAASTGKRA